MSVAEIAAAGKAFPENTIPDAAIASSDSGLVDFAAESVDESTGKSVDESTCESVDEIEQLVVAVESGTDALWTSISGICDSIDDIYTFSDRGKLLTAEELDRLGDAFATMYPILIGIVLLAALIASVALMLAPLLTFLKHNPMFLVLALYLPKRFCHRPEKRRGIAGVRRIA